MQLTNALLISSLLFTLGGCCGGGKTEPASRWDTPGAAGKPATTTTATATTKATTTATATTAAATATADAPKPKADAKPLDSKAANNLFPADGTMGFKRTFKADKAGYWEAEYKKDKDTLTLTISDSLADKSLDFKKYSTATEKVGNFPYIKFGNNKSQILVKDHVQLAASSTTIDEATRKTWLQKFDTGSVP